MSWESINWDRLSQDMAALASMNLDFLNPAGMGEVDWFLIQNMLLGLGLSAACGFRIFLPPLVVSVAALFFGLQLPAEIQWMGTQTAFVVSLTASVLEIGAYYVPWLDNALDHLSSPLSVVAGTALSLGFLGDIPPEMKWPIAIVAGGGMAGTFQALTNTTRLTSALATFGLANPIIATVENLMALFMSVLAIVFPLVAIVFVLIALTLILAVVWWFSRRKKKKLAMAAAASFSSESPSSTGEQL